MARKHQPDSFFSYEGSLFMVEEGVKNTIRKLFVHWVTGSMFQGGHSNQQSVLVVPNWLDAAIIVEQMQGQASFLESATTPEGVTKFITAGA